MEVQLAEKARAGKRLVVGQKGKLGERLVRESLVEKEREGERLVERQLVAELLVRVEVKLVVGEQPWVQLVGKQLVEKQLREKLVREQLEEG